ncbi:hypothetical protein P8452_17170 [Trifolium repens]|nr:hypothetical protein P8452_17170 [Trifolium repens]
MIILLSLFLVATCYKTGIICVTNGDCIVENNLVCPPPLRWKGILQSTACSLPARYTKVATSSKRNGRFQVRASMKEKVVTGLTAAALTASMVVPDVAEAAVSPSLKNFLLSITAGGIVVVVILGAVIAVSNFDPVKRN